MSSQTPRPPEAPVGLTKDSLSAQAHRYLRQALMSGRFQPGEKIKLKEISEELGISQTPVREALARLVSSGVLSQVDRRSVRVAILPPERYKEIRDLRVMLEGEAAWRAAQLARGTDIDQLEQIHNQLCNAKEAKDYLAMMTENVHFHQSLCDLADMPFLSRIVRNLWLQCGPTVNAFTAHPPCEPRETHPHLAVLQALRKRDGEKAKSSIQEDILASSNLILSYLEERLSEEQGRD